MVLLTTEKQWASARFGLLWRGVLMAGFALVCTGAPAMERHAYRYMDENGKVAYSEFPPTGIASRKVDTTPAVTGHTGATPRPRYGEDSRYPSARQDSSPELERKQAKIAAEAREKKLAAAKADECRRNHGIGCRNPKE
jgi:hypothetical protein